MADPIVLTEDEGEELHARGSALLFKAVAATTGGAFSLHQRTIPAGGRRPPAHRHTDCVEAFYVVGGVAEIVVGDAAVQGGAGTFVLVPGGVAHTFGNAGEAPARVLVLHSPAMDDYFRELETLWAGDAPPERAAELELMRRHGMEPVQ